MKPSKTVKKPNKSKKTHIYTVNRLATILGVDRRTVTRAMAGITPARIVGGRRLYALADAQLTLVARTSPELREQKLRELTLRADRMELRLQKERGELTDTAVLADKVLPLLAEIQSMTYAKLYEEAPLSMAGLDVASARIVGRRMADELIVKWSNLLLKGLAGA